jgi:outer membrane biosynthesis protein TonB
LHSTYCPPTPDACDTVFSVKSLRRKLIPFLALVCSPFAGPAAGGQSPQPDAQIAAVKIYRAGPDVTAPELLPSTAPHSYVNDHCQIKEQGRTTFSVIVDGSGEPRNIYFLSPYGDDIDVLALKTVREDHFKPGTHGGVPVAVAASVEVSLNTCLHEQRDANGKSQLTLGLSAPVAQKLISASNAPDEVVLTSGTGLTAGASDSEAGIEKIGGDVTAAHMYRPPDLTLNRARNMFEEGDYKVSVVVDRYGMPERLRILRAAHSGHEQDVASIVRLLRYKPAMKKGEPVAVRVDVSFDFE